jgi:hypothetical protein
MFFSSWSCKEGNYFGVIIRVMGNKGLNIKTNKVYKHSSGGQAIKRRNQKWKIDFNDGYM